MPEQRGDTIFNYWGKAAHAYPPVREQYPGWHLLVYHSLDVAAVGAAWLDASPALMRQLTDMTGLDAKKTRAWVLFFLALHDVGKFAQSFQNLKRDILKAMGRSADGKPYTTRHDSLGFLVWRESIAPALANTYPELAEPWADAWMAAMTGHHGEPPKTDGFLDNDFTAADKIAALKFVEELAALLLPERISMDECSVRRSSWLLAGLVMVCDWLGSDTRWFNYCATPMPLADYWPNTLKHARRAVDESGVLPVTINPNVGMSNLFPKDLFPSIAAPSPLQQYAETVSLGEGPRLFILEDLTGAGKTEAALVLAHRLMAAGQADGLYMALPTMATANQMYERLGACYRRMFDSSSSPSLMLAHSARDQHKGFRASVMQAVMGDEEQYAPGDATIGAFCNEWIADHRKAALLAHVGVGTVDQALLAVLHVRHQALRLLGLSRRVLVVDEVHACDRYMEALLRRLLTFHAALGGSVILLSATLPFAMRQGFANAFHKGLEKSNPSEEYYSPFVSSRNKPNTGVELTCREFPFATALPPNGVVEKPVPVRSGTGRTVKVRRVGDEKSVIDTLVAASNAGQCACWVRNTVDDATSAYDDLKKQLGERVSLFHARYALGDRLTIETRENEHFDKNSRAQQRHGRVLVATQVVEQSLDWDFDVMASDLAPVDLLIQRAGRIRRHIRDKSGNTLSAGESDQRGTPELILLAPEPVPEPKADWVSNLLRGTAYVYPHHGELWATTRLLESDSIKSEGIKLPEDARRLIEGVFAPEEDYPAGLQKVAMSCEGNDSAAKSLALSNLLELDPGYILDLSWADDVLTPTRLGEPSQTVYLARRMADGLHPWSDKGWAHSGLNMRIYRIKQEVNENEVAGIKETLPGKGKGAVMLVLEQSEGCIWQGAALDGEGRQCVWRYDAEIGLTQEQGGK